MLRVLLALLVGLTLSLLGAPGPTCACASQQTGAAQAHACCGKKALSGEGASVCRGQCDHRIRALSPPSPVDRALSPSTDAGAAVALLTPAQPRRGPDATPRPRARGARGPPGTAPPAWLRHRSLRC